MSADTIKLIDAAVDYARQGWQIVPVHNIVAGKCSCGKPNCPRAGKHPRIRKWIELASCNEPQIQKWWRKWPSANVGVATGSGSGIVVLDIDGQTGTQSLNTLAGDDPVILETRIHQTGSGGAHLIYRHPGFPCGNGVRLLPGIDIRGDSGLIILPPSNHQSGNRYSVLNDLPIADLPQSLWPLFSQCHKERQREIRSDEENQRVTRQGGRTAELSPQTTANRRRKLEWALSQALPTTQGKRHRQVFELARNLLSVDGITQDIPAEQLRPIIERWHCMALEQAERVGFTIHGDIEESWSDFQFAWGRVEYPSGGQLSKVFDHVAALDADGNVDPLAWNALAYFRRTENREMRILTGVVLELARCCGDDPFSLACHAGASQFGRLGIEKDHKWVYRRLQSMTHEGILACVDPGKAGVKGERRAAQFRWIWTMTDPPTNDLAKLLDGL